MKKHMMKSLPALLLAAGLAFSGIAQADDHSTVWTGIDFAPRSVYGYVGGLTSLQGQSTAQEGWVAAIHAGDGRARYNTTSVGSGHVTNDFSNADIMIGYRALSGPATASFYIGPDWEDLREHPTDPHSHRGGEAGAKAQLQTITNFSENTKFGAMGSYSTAFQTYWSRVDGSYNIRHWFALGAEVQFFGNHNFNQIREGGAISDIKLGPASFRLNAGAEQTNRNGKNGAYGGVSVSGGF